LSPSNAEFALGATPARLSLPAKIRFPETETGSFGDWFESAVYAIAPAALPWLGAFKDLVPLRIWCL
jgi:hypothetical protein